jgi:hypothetical protein
LLGIAGGFQASDDRNRPEFAIRWISLNGDFAARFDIHVYPLNGFVQLVTLMSGSIISLPGLPLPYLHDNA